MKFTSICVAALLVESSSASQSTFKQLMSNNIQQFLAKEEVKPHKSKKSSIKLFKSRTRRKAKSKIWAD